MWLNNFSPDILSLRLFYHRLTGEKFSTPQEVVSYFGAVQSQDFSNAKWSLGLRIANTTNEAVEKAYNEGKILRTHVLRPTWHFIVPEDIHSFLALSAPSIKQVMAYYNRRLGLTEEVLNKANRLIEKSLRNHNFLTRQELKTKLEGKGIKTNIQSLGHIVLNSEIDGIITSGPMRGKQFTYALLEERAPIITSFDKSKSLAKLAEKYFTSHGPALLKDFAWWSGLSIKDAKEGLAMVASKLEKIVVNEKTYWLSSQEPLQKKAQDIFLFSVYDEYFISYTDRGELYDKKYKEKLPVGNALLTSLLISNGKIAGTWKRRIHKNTIEFILSPFVSLTKKQAEAIQEVVKDYGRFFALQTTVKINSSLESLNRL